MSPPGKAEWEAVTMGSASASTSTQPHGERAAAGQPPEGHQGRLFKAKPSRPRKRCPRSGMGQLEQRHKRSSPGSCTEARGRSKRAA